MSYAVFIRRSGPQSGRYQLHSL